MVIVHLLFSLAVVKTNQFGGDLARCLKLQLIYQELVPKLIPKFSLKASEFIALKGYPTTSIKVISNNSGTTAFVPATPLIAEVKNRQLPRAVMFGDSFAYINLNSFLKEHFQRIVFVGQYVFDVELIQKEQPDVVIQEIVERGLVGPVPQGFINSIEIRNDKIQPQRSKP